MANLDENNKNEESFGSDDEVRSFYTAVNQLDRVPQKRPLLFFFNNSGVVDKSVRCSYQIFSGFNIPKIIKIG